VGLKTKKLGTRLRIKISYISAHRTATVERFSPTLLAHAIAAQAHARHQSYGMSQPIRPPF
jgi:hypothetical protein